ncbi:2-iminoacetate synthase ThiH [Ammoniphilus sp. 3BR4]|uniref:2-iminoacetate synthase ThiH n=1 Tax=Ammoniphilus sp. 3BR4 TaxID=3158265 RepID=UPI0034659FFD
MGFYEEYKKLKNIPFEEFFQNCNQGMVKRVLEKDQLDERDFLILLSPIAKEFLKEMSEKTRQLTTQQFGHQIQLFTPMYLADYCVNHCAYCSFSIIHGFERKKLSMQEIEEEANQIAKTGIKQILILTGESRIETPVSYIKESVQVLKKHFSSIAIEIYPLNTEEYQELVEAGVEGLTIYQEVYNEDIYKEIHIKGPKRNYLYRLDVPERGCIAGMRSVNIGALLGMDDWRKESFFTGAHANYLQNKYPLVNISISPPRLRPHLGSFQPKSVVSDEDLIQIVLALRLYQPKLGLTLSTREGSELRDRMVHLGITKMSAGVSTEVGGYSQQNEEKGVQQFQISDERTAEELIDRLVNQGYQPILDKNALVKV